MSDSHGIGWTESVLAHRRSVRTRDNETYSSRTHIALASVESNGEPHLIGPHGLLDKCCSRRGVSHPAMMLTEANNCRVANNRHEAADDITRKLQLPHRQDTLTVCVVS